MRELQRTGLLVVEAGGLRAGLPLSQVREIMRPLPIAELAGAPPFVLGLSIVRGQAVPVVDLGAVIGRSTPGESFGRFASLLVEGRAVALAVRAVIGVLELDSGEAAPLPPLLGGAAAEAVDELALRDAALLLLLRTARLLPPAQGTEALA
jgi:purine-binding chemotaxis protein CheW